MSNTIDIYSREGCPACAKAEALVAASDPAGHGAVLTIHDVTDDMSVKSTPVLVIGDTEIDGYYEGRINDALTALYDSLAPQPVDTTPPVDTPPVDTTPPAPQPDVALPDVTDSVQASVISPKAALILGAVVGFLAYRYLSNR